MLIRRAAIAAVAIAAPLAFAAPAMAQPPVDIDCAPCAPGSDTPIWTEFFETFGPWEPFFEATDGLPGGNGAWEAIFDATDGVPNDQEGAWEKAFPPAE